MKKSQNEKQIQSLGYKSYKDFYLDYTNNFITVSAFAEHLGIPKIGVHTLLDYAVDIYAKEN